MAGTHGWGMGYYLEIKRIKIDELERVQSSRGGEERRKVMVAHNIFNKTEYIAWEIYVYVYLLIFLMVAINF